MPDGDKFERELRGKGWRKVYRLACSGASNAAEWEHFSALQLLNLSDRQAA